jgi:hypothetical protein
MLEERTGKVNKAAALCGLPRPRAKIDPAQRGPAAAFVGDVTLKSDLEGQE